MYLLLLLLQFFLLSFLLQFTFTTLGLLLLEDVFHNFACKGVPLSQLFLKLLIMVIVEVSNHHLLH